MVNIRNSNGQLCIAIFSNETEFHNETPCWQGIYDKSNMTNNEITVSIPFKEGRWGISVLDDENMNEKMEYNIFGIPREGFGFSNYTQKGIKKPGFDDFSFNLGCSELTCIVRMKYF